MGFEKGNSHGKGRPEGSRNHRTAQWDALVESLEGEQAENFSRFMRTLWNGTKYDQVTAANLYLKLLEFHKPKLNRTAMDAPPGSEVTYTLKFK